MLVIDTNLIVRYLTGDHPEQSPKARALIDREDVFVCTTVLLETEWVLRSAYGYTPSQIGTALTAFAGLPQVTLEMPLSRDGSRLDDQGLDFADALHLARGAGCTAFISFDQRFAKAANRISDVKVRAP